MNKITEMIQENKFKDYLGDSVYANYDGYHIILTTENGLPGDPSNRIALESEVLRALNRYKDRLLAMINEARDDEAKQKEMEDCKECQQYKKDNDKLAPPHFASDNCESGKLNHCTCDTCS